MRIGRRDFLRIAAQGAAAAALSGGLPAFGLREEKTVSHWATYETEEFAAEIGDNSSRQRPFHNAGYNGIWSLRPRELRENLFWDPIAGMNLEHYFDGATDMTAQEARFDPRYSPMTFERPSSREAVLRQPPTRLFGVESLTRFTAFEPYYIDFEFQCIPRRDYFPHGYLGAFWANYLNEPEELEIHFLGYRSPDQQQPQWIKTCGGPYYGRGTKLAPPPHEKGDFFSHTLFRRGEYDWAEPHFYGTIRGYLFLLMFECQFPLGIYAGSSPGGWNPWDFQILIPRPRVGKAYGLSARLCVTRFQGQQHVAEEIARWKRLCQDRKGRGEEH